MDHHTTHPLDDAVIQVSDAAEYVAAIKSVNRGEGSAIDVVEPFTLTTAAPNITSSVKLYSSTGASIDAQGYTAVEVVGAGVSVTLNLVIEGSGYTQIFQGQLTGLDGGQVHDVMLVKNGALQVPSGQSFTVTGQLEAVSKGVIGIGGVLNATNTLTLSNGGLIVTQSDENPCAITQNVVADQGTIIAINPDSTLTVEGLSLSNDCLIEGMGDNTTILSASPILLEPEAPSKTARMVAVNASAVTLKPGGVYQGCGATQGGGAGQHVRVDTLLNEGGVVDLGGSGALKCNQFTQTDGMLTVALADCQGEGPTLVVDEGGTVTGGAFVIKGPGAQAKPPEQAVKLPLVVTVEGNTLPADLKGIAELNDFPDSVSAALSVEPENALVLTLTPV